MIDIDVYDDLFAIACHVFLHYNCIRSGRHRRASENPDRFATRNPQPPVQAGWLFANHAQALVSFARVRHDCITIHRGIIESWQRQPCEMIFGSEKTQRF